MQRTLDKNASVPRMLKIDSEPLAKATNCRQRSPRRAAQISPGHWSIWSALPAIVCAFRSGAEV